MGTLKKSVVNLKKAKDGYKHPEEAEDRKSEKITPMKPVGKASTSEAKLVTKKAETFGEAFKRNRAAGAKTFTHNGKSYTTQTKEDTVKKATPATPAKPATPATPAKKAEPAKKVELSSKTADLVKKATGKQLVDRSDTRHPNYKSDSSGYKRPGTPAKAKPGSGAPLKSYPNKKK